MHSIPDANTSSWSKIRRRHCTRELHFIGHTITASYVQKEAGSAACCLLTGKTHTFLTEYHGIHTDKLVFSSISRLLNFIYHYIIDLFSVYYFCSYITLLYKWENRSVERVHHSAVTSLVGLRSSTLNLRHSTLSANYLHRHHHRHITTQ